MNKKNNEEMVRQIREIGESLMKDAEDMVGDTAHIISIEIKCEVDAYGIPSINVVKKYYPEKYIRRIRATDAKTK